MADTIKDTIIAYAKNYTRQETGMIMGGEHLSLDQAIAEIKRIVSEAKPSIDLLDIGVLTGANIAIQKDGKKNHNAPESEQKYTDKGVLELHQATYITGYRMAVESYKDNLMKALGE